MVMFGKPTCDCDLSTNVAELRESSMEQSVLLPERFDSCVCVSGFRLESHVRIGNLWYGRADVY